MANHRTPDDRVRVEHPAGRPTVAIVLVLAAAAIGVAVLSAMAGSRDRAARRDAAGAELVGPAGVAAAYGYPLRCLSVTIAQTDHAYARADFDHRRPCGRYDGYVTAIFYRTDGAWLPVLDATSYSCPVGTLPIAVQKGLGVCP